MLKLQNMPNAQIAPSAILKMENQEQSLPIPKTQKLKTLK